MALTIAALVLAFLSALGLGLARAKHPSLRDRLGAGEVEPQVVPLLHDLWCPPVVLHPG